MRHISSRLSDGLTEVWLFLYRGVICGHVAKNRVTRVTSNRHLFYLILVLAVVFGVAAWVCYSGANEASGYINTACSVIEGENVLKAGSLIDKGSALREVCIVFFIIATIPLAVQAAFLLYAELVGPGGPPTPRCDLEFTHGLALCPSMQIISALRCLTQNTCRP